MSLGFGTPVLLAGLATALLPLLVHLLRRRPPRPTLFPAFMLLVGPTERDARRRRLRELLLLATRMALLALVALTLAGPHLSRGVPVPPSAARHQAAVILVDDTLSMRYRHAGRPLFEEARRRVAALLDVLPPTAPAALLTVTDQGSQVIELGVDRAPLRRALARMRATHMAASGAQAVARALRVLASAPPGAPRSIYLMTDLTRTGLALPPGLIPRDTALQVIDVAPRAMPNRAVEALELGADPAGAPGAARRFRVILRNSTDQEEGMRVRLLVGDREVAKASVVVPSHASSPVELSVPISSLSEPARFVEAALGAADSLAEDDRRFLPFGRGPGTRVLLVDGDPRETRHEDELFYLEAALGALASQVPLRVRVVAAGDLDGQSLGDEDLVVLANVPAPSRAVLALLGAFVRGGGALIVALGDQMDVEAYNETLGVSLLPGRIRAVRSGGGSGPEGPPVRVDPDQLAPALGSALEDPESRRALRGARVQRYGLLEGLRGEVLLRLDTGAPLLVARAHGAGRVLLFTTTVDRDWSDLALRPAFVPLVRGLISYLTGQGAAGQAQVLAGRPVVLRALAGERLVVQAPGGSLHRLEPVGADGAVTFLRTGTPGPYRVFAVPPGRAEAPPASRSWLGGGVPALTRPVFARLATGLGAAPFLAASPSSGLRERPSLAFAVVTDPAESDLRRLGRAPGQPGLVGATPTGGGPLPAAIARQDLVPLFVLLCLLLLLLEGVLAARFSRWRGRRGGLDKWLAP